MSPIPGEPLDPKPPELTTRDGRKVKLKIPGLAPLGKPDVADDTDEPPRDDSD